jgi:putative SOS response-associated peptidase YedK
LQPYASESMSAYEIGRAVNAVANDGPELIAPV